MLDLPTYPSIETIPASLALPRIRRRYARLASTPSSARARSRAWCLFSLRLIRQGDFEHLPGALARRRQAILVYRMQLSLMLAEPRPRLP